MAVEHAVALVLIRDFGSRLEGLAERLHVWLVDTPTNLAEARRIWSESRARSLERGVTVFDAGTAADPDEIARQQLDTIDLHHGSWSHDPPWSRLEVYGARPTSDLVADLVELGFTKIAATPDGFTATRPPLTGDA